jgi:hypothetical protein
MKESKPTPTPMSESAQKSIVNTIEKYMPDQDKTLPASELISHFVVALGESAEDNPIIKHLVQNNEKSFNSNQLKIIAGKAGVEEYKAIYEASVDAEKTPDDVNALNDTNTPEALNRAMNDPSGPKEITLNEKIKELTPELKVIFNNIKTQWLKTNKEKFPELDEKDLDNMANQLVYDSLMASLKKQELLTPNNGKEKCLTDGERTIATGITRAGSETLLNVAKNAFKLTSKAGGALMEGAYGAAKGLKNKVKVNVMEEPPTIERSYSGKIAKESVTNLGNALESLKQKVDVLNYKKEKGRWGKEGMTAESNKILDSIEKSLDNINDLKSILSTDLKRQGVDKESQLEGLKELERTRHIMNKMEEKLGDTPKESEIKEKSAAIKKSIDRIVKILKSLFTKKKDIPEVDVENENTLSR